MDHVASRLQNLGTQKRFVVTNYNRTGCYITIPDAITRIIISSIIFITFPIIIILASEYFSLKIFELIIIIIIITEESIQILYNYYALNIF